MTTARTHQRNVGRGPGATPLTGAARPRVSAPTPDDFMPVSAEVFGEAAVSLEASVEGDEPLDPSTLAYDPADHKAEEVKAYVSENPEAADVILELELNGKARSGLLSFLDNFTDETED